MVKDRFPEHAIFARSTASSWANGRRTWVFDPIDGTKSFITGKPLWGTLVRCCAGVSPCWGS